MDDQNQNNSPPSDNPNSPPDPIASDPVAGSPVSPPAAATTPTWPNETILSGSTATPDTPEPPPNPVAADVDPGLNIPSQTTPVTPISPDPGLTPPTSSLASEPVGITTPLTSGETPFQPTGWPSSSPDPTPPPTFPAWPQPQPQTTDTNLPSPGIGISPTPTPSLTVEPAAPLPHLAPTLDQTTPPVAPVPEPPPEPVPTFTAPTPEVPPAEPDTGPTTGEPAVAPTAFPLPDQTTQTNPADLNSAFNSPPAAPNFPQEPAPTDLSHLTGNDQPLPPEVYTPPVTSPENLVVPTTNSAPESIDTGNNHRRISKKLLIGGVAIVLVITVASAYFILGVGRTSTPAPTPVSQPALTNPPPPRSVATPIPVATGAATFGGLNNPTGPQATASASPSSALEKLRARQTPTPTPK